MASGSAVPLSHVRAWLVFLRLGLPPAHLDHRLLQLNVVNSPTMPKLPPEDPLARLHGRSAFYAALEKHHGAGARKQYHIGGVAVGMPGMPMKCLQSVGNPRLCGLCW